MTPQCAACAAPLKPLTTTTYHCPGCGRVATDHQVQQQLGGDAQEAWDCWRHETRRRPR